MTRFARPLWCMSILLLCPLAAPGPARAAHITVAGSADTVAVTPGQAFTLDLVVRDVGPAFNAFDLSVHFDPTRLTNTPISPLTAQRGPLMTSACITNSPFHIFTATPDSLVCTLVILCSEVSVTGPGTIYRVRFVAGSTQTWTTVSFGAGTSFFNGGPRVDSLVKLPIVVKIGSPTTGVGGAGTPLAGPELDAISPNPGRKPGSLAISFRLPRADAAEVTLLDTLGRRVAGSPASQREAGAQHLRLDLPKLAPGRYTLVLRTGAGEVRTQPWVVLR